MPGHGTRPLELLREAGVVHRAHEYRLPSKTGRERDARPNYGLEAAEALGLPPAVVFKTLVATVDGALVLAVLPVRGELDLKALAASVDGRRATLADPPAAERATGYVIGGISPLAARRSLPVVVDASAVEHPTIHVSAGRRGLQVELDPHDLVRLAGARLARICRAERPAELGT